MKNKDVDVCKLLQTVHYTANSIRLESNESDIRKEALDLIKELEPLYKELECGKKLTI